MFVFEISPEERGKIAMCVSFRPSLFDLYFMGTTIDHFSSKLHRILAGVKC
jgi:hypothetical protein